ncbi:hypothetical protein CesoFtcFv8_000620 [Champsocephalus esox]|uniref:Uncharacterized protein n=1 Tax=Champsocephalus esox TaxID=159716 RepID=A0AAN8D797_9TELE|nr:hypothetical protein CesoFtcFv8_000620 [Champsocephalus esox]
MGKRHVEKTEFQVAKHPNCSPPNGPSVPSIIPALAEYVGDEVMPHSSRPWREASFPTPQPHVLSGRPSFDVLVI